MKPLKLTLIVIRTIGEIGLKAKIIVGRRRRKIAIFYYKRRYLAGLKAERKLKQYGVIAEEKPSPEWRENPETASERYGEHFYEDEEFSLERYNHWRARIRAN
jgi:hypothetical protein